MNIYMHLLAEIGYDTAENEHSKVCHTGLTPSAYTSLILFFTAQHSISHSLMHHDARVQLLNGYTAPQTPESSKYRMSCTISVSQVISNVQLRNLSYVDSYFRRNRGAEKTLR